MALGSFSLFSFKSKETLKKEQEEYAKWAFPHGQAQRDAVEKLLAALFPKETPMMTLIPFLTCKELYEGMLSKSGSSEKAIDTLINEQRSYKQIIKKKDMAAYVALVLADAAIDEKCEYPDADGIKETIRELEGLRR